MIAGTIWWRYEEKKQLHLLAIKAIEIDPCLAQTNRTDESADAGMLGMRNRNAAPNSRAS